MLGTPQDFQFAPLDELQKTYQPFILRRQSLFHAALDKPESGLIFPPTPIVHLQQIDYRVRNVFCVARDAREFERTAEKRFGRIEVSKPSLDKTEHIKASGLRDRVPHLLVHGQGLLCEGERLR